MGRIYLSKLIIVTLMLVLFPGIQHAVTIYPIETDELLKNPGKGWMTMFKAAVHDTNLPSYIPSSLYYFRINWEQIHIGPNQYNWEPIDRAITDAQQGGQQIMIRLMPVWEDGNSPLWMRNNGFRGYFCKLDGEKWVADLDDARVQFHISELLKNMGKRYDSHPGVHSVEINFYGVYGEGHFNECEHVPMPAKRTQRWLADQHYLNFPNLPIIGPIDASQEKYLTQHMYRKYGNTRGAGIFMDAWGDYGQYNHMEVRYPKWLNAIHGGKNWDSWKKGIIKLEPTGVMNEWERDIPSALKWAHKMHASFIGNKDAAFPAAFTGTIEEALRRLGYRILLRKLEHPDVIVSGGSLPVTLEFENTGVAPPYRDHYLAVRLQSDSGERFFITNKSVKFWLPGTHSATLVFSVPGDMNPGDYELAVGIVNPFDQKPSIMMPILGREASGWHPLSRLSIRTRK